MNNVKGDYYDFHDFFHLFMGTQVSSLRECLLEWLYQSQIISTDKKRSTHVFIPTSTQSQIVPVIDSEIEFNNNGCNNESENSEVGTGSVDVLTLNNTIEVVKDGMHSDDVLNIENIENI